MHDAPEKAKLLIVDDDLQVRTLLSVILTKSGHRVCSAEDGFSALAEMRKEIPDIILSDLNMPGMSGFELLSVVRRRFPAIRVVAWNRLEMSVFCQPTGEEFSKTRACRNLTTGCGMATQEQSESAKDVSANGVRRRNWRTGLFKVGQIFAVLCTQRPNHDIERVSLLRVRATILLSCS